MKSNWVIAKQNLKLRNKISEKLDISPVIAQVLINRGIKDELEAESFLNPRLFDLPSPFLMKDMDIAVERLYKAQQQNETIAIYGDYDVDGVTSTSLFYNFIKKLGMHVVTYNPDRISEGYGINKDAIKKLSEKGVTLIISGDCGITAFDEVEYAKELGIDFIITDHHQPPEKIPNSVAVLNPHQEDCGYPAKEITGVGVVFNLVVAFRRFLRDKGFFKDNEPNLADYLDLVALGTVADCAPVVNVNRIMVKEGVKRMNNPKRIGIKVLKDVSGVNGEVNSSDLGFKLGPRINAVGRLKNPQTAVDLFTTDDPEIAMSLANNLNEENINRQSIEKNILNEAIQLYEENEKYKDSSSIVLSSKSWHQGVVGIVASRLSDLYRKPTFLIALDENGFGKGSGRSVEGVDIYKIISSFKQVFEEYGGHEQAAGITIKEGKIDSFREMFSEAVSKIEVTKEKIVNIDMEIELSAIDFKLLNDIQELAPFGLGNPEPVFMVKSVNIKDQRLFKEKHLGATIKRDDVSLKAMWFNIKDKTDLPGVVDIVFTPEINYWNGNRELRLNIKDVYRGE
ncbi:MAG: single-stranded-DNA-specific exonuclease RecJ [Thermodesulfobacteriota bacterium]